MAKNMTLHCSIIITVNQTHIFHAVHASSRWEEIPPYFVVMSNVFHQAQQEGHFLGREIILFQSTQLQQSLGVLSRS